MSFIVYKLGGSLLTLPDLATRLRAEFARRHERPLLVVGGGEAADIVRRWDEQFRIGEERAHWLALRAMALNERLVHSILPESRIVRTIEELAEAWGASAVPILCVHDFLGTEEEAFREAREPPALLQPLPHIWDVTSDSIAAWVALQLGAKGVVLLKSCERSETSSLGTGDDEGVDRYFATLEPQLRRVEWVNLRATSIHLGAHSESN